jgi:hypothetical protein
MAKAKEEITVVVELGDDGVLGVRANVPGVRVIIADYDVPDDWNADGMGPALQALESEPDNYFQKINLPATHDVVGVKAFKNTIAYTPEDADDDLPRFT